MIYFHSALISLLFPLTCFAMSSNYNSAPASTTFCKTLFTPSSKNSKSREDPDAAVYDKGIALSFANEPHEVDRYVQNNQKLTTGAKAARYSTELTLELAKTDLKREWGLMNRTFLAPNSGMLFCYPKPQTIQVWMFNCYIDLDIAFFDAKYVITELFSLDAHPEVMDPRRPVKTLNDLKKYPPNDPIVLFFLRQAATTSQPAIGFIEMNKGWLASEGIQPGDQLEILGTKARFLKRERDKP